MTEKPLISYILPICCAESFIYKNLVLFSKYCSESPYRSEIIAVNDGSTDRTNDEVERFLRENTGGVPVKYINLVKNAGKGHAIKTGIEASEGQYIIFTDCDLPYSFKNIGDVVENLVSNTANVVIANRMHGDSVYKIKSQDLSYIYVRHTGGRFYNWLINLFTQLNIMDTQAGLKGFDRDTAKLIFSKMTINGFSFDIDILVCAKKHGKKISTVPIEYDFAEMSTISFVKQTFIMTMSLLRIYMKLLTGYYTRQS